MTAVYPSLRRGFAVLATAEVLTRVLALAGVVAVSRLVGPARFGQLAVALAVLAYASVMGDAGLTVWSQREVLRDRTPQGVRRVVSATLAVQTVLCSSLIALLLGLVPYLPLPDGATRLVLAGLPLLLAQAFSLLYLVQAQEQMASLARLRVLNQLIASVGGVTAVYVTNDIVWMPVMMWVAALVTDAAALRVARAFGLLLSAPRATEMSRAAISGLPYLGNGLVVAVLANLDVILVGALRGADEAGIYGAAYRLAFAALSLASVVVAAVFPRLISRWYDDRAGFERLVQALVILSARLTLPVTALVLVGGPQIVLLIFGDGFAASGDVLRVLFLWVSLGWLNTMTGHALVAAGRQTAHLVVAAISGLVTVGLLLVLVTSAGAQGAAIAVALTEVVISAGFLLLGRSLLSLKLETHFVRQLAYFLIPLAVLLPIQLYSPNLVLPVGTPVLVLILVFLERFSKSPTLALMRGTGSPPGIHDR